MVSNDDVNFITDGINLQNIIVEHDSINADWVWDVTVPTGKLWRLRAVQMYRPDKLLMELLIVDPTGETIELHEVVGEYDLVFQPTTMSLPEGWKIKAHMITPSGSIVVEVKVLYDEQVDYS